MHELSYETKATGKEQYHNNFGCYGFVSCSDVSYPVPTFQKRWPGAWMQEWFYVKNNLVEREDIKGIIQCPIWSRFGIRRLAIVLGDDIQACQTAFNTVCTYIGTRDLVQEHIAYRVWPLGSGWEMPKEAAAGSSQSSLVYLKYTFRYRDQFDEPNDDWLDCIEATSDELLRAYTRAEDDAMTLAFGGRGKKRLNRVFDVIGFMYLDYCYPSRKRGKKMKVVASAISATPKGKKIKVLTHRPRHSEMAKVPKSVEGSYSAAEPNHPATAEAIVGSAKEPMSKVAAEKPKAKTADMPKCLAKVREKMVEEPGLKKLVEQPKTSSLQQETELPKVAKIPAVTPKWRRMASVLDTVMESTKVPTPASTEVPSMSEKNIKETAEAVVIRVEAEAGSSVPTETGPAELVEKDSEQRPLDAAKVPLLLEEERTSKESKFPAVEASTKGLEFIVCHAAGKKLSKEQVTKARQYAKDLKYPPGSLVFNGTNKNDFLYCLPDNKEISICREMAENIGFLKLELVLSAMSKDDLADSLVYNSLKVVMF
jgi:hypothetical protein